MTAKGDREPVVLLVDDDAAVRRSVAEGLELEGFEVVAASGGRAALAAMETVTPAVVVLDLAMPDLDGLEVLRRLRDAGQDVPVCILSARDEVDDRVRGLEAGDLVVDPAAACATRGDRDLELTRREMELLALFVRRPGEILTRREMHEEVWGYTFDPGTNVADVFVGYLRRKLEAGGEPRILHTVRSVGFVLQP